MKFVFSNNVSTLLYEELSANASEMRTQKLPEGIHWPSINNSEGEVAPCTIIDPATRAWEIIYVKEVIEGPTYDTLKITRGEEETGPNSFSKNSRVELRVTAGSLYANAQNTLDTIPNATKSTKGLVKIGENLSIASDGTLSAPSASSTVEGMVKIGEGLEFDTSGALVTSVKELPVATTTETGIVQLSNATDSTSETLAATAKAVKAAWDKASNATTAASTPATTTSLGVVKIGNRLNVTADGTLSAPLASSTIEGMVKIGEGLEFDANGALVTSVKELPTASTAKSGIVQLSSVVNSTSETLAATSKAVKTAYDKANSAATAASTPATTSNLGVVRIGQGISVDANGTISTTPVSAATTAKAGIVQLSSAVDSTSETLAATPKAVKTAYDKAVDAKNNSKPTLFNTRLVITSSNSAWTPPVTGWARVTVIGGGGKGGQGTCVGSRKASGYGGSKGGDSRFGNITAVGGSGGGGSAYISGGGGGGAGQVTIDYVLLTKGSPVNVVIGAGATSKASTRYGAGSNGGLAGQASEYGSGGGQGAKGAGTGQGNGAADHSAASGGCGGSNGTGYGGGGGGGAGVAYQRAGVISQGGNGGDNGSSGESLTSNTGSVNITSSGGNGGPGAVIIEYYDPNKESA